MTDASLFTTGGLFTQDYLIEAIKGTAHYRQVDAPGMRAALSDILTRFPHGSGPNEATTEQDLIWPILHLLGWTDYLTQQNLSGSGRVDVPDALLFIDAGAKAQANAHPEEWRRYAFGAAIVESKRWGRALDRAEGRKGDDRDTPSTQLLRYLRRVDDLTQGGVRWGILTNGAKWRLYFSGARSTIDDYLELDFARIMGLAGDALLDSAVSEAERDHWLAVFVAMFSRTAFERATTTSPSFHDTARRDAALYEERVASNLSDLVFDRLYPALGRAVAQAAPAGTDLDEIRQATLILLYRLLFILYAEDRSLLPVSDRRFDDYALRKARLDVGERKDAGDSFSTVAKTIWNRFADLSEMIDKGDESVGLPPYNGGLFNAERTPLLKAIALGDAIMSDALDILSFEQRGGRRRYINYRDLSVQQLGSIYERLLEFELVRDDAGAVDVRPNLFARKNSGSYYTPDDLVLLILDETLAPLIDDAMAAFRAALKTLKPGDSEDYRITQLQKADPARAIARLRICDPAMGSGHFLVNLVDRLTNHTLDAMAEAAAMARDIAKLDYESPVAEEVRKVRSTIRHNAEDARWSVSEEQLDDPQLVKRMVLKRCIYGADKNPMAVELAKVALWLHTFTVGAPLSFIDHHLAAGDSLFGLWVRDAIDKAGQGGALFLHEPISNAQRQAAAMQTIEALTDAEVAEAHRSAAMWHDVEAQTGPLDGFVSFMHALDWLDLKKPDKALVTLWLDGRFGDPIPIARGRVAPEPGKAKREEVERFTAIWKQARELIDEERFLNWQIAFPGVWTNWSSAAREGGFDAIVGNPPWDRIKLQQVEWFAARRPEIAKAQRASDRKQMIAKLKETDAPLYDDFLKAEGRALASARISRDTGYFPLMSQGDIDIYKLFVERAESLINKRGMVGLVTPIGVGADNYAAAFFSKLAARRRLRAFIAFENRRHWLFADVHTEDQPTIIVYSGEGRESDSFKYAVKLDKIPTGSDNLIQNLTAEILARVNPNTGTAPILRNAEDLPLITGIYSRVPVLLDKSSDAPVATWPVRYVTMFHMTNDSALFRTRAELEGKEGAWPVRQSRWQSSSGEWLPLFEGKSIQIDNHRYAGIAFSHTGTSGQGVSIHANKSDWSNAMFSTVPRYWVAASNVHPRKEYHFSFNGICNSNNERTLISAIIPDVGCGNSLPILDTDGAISKCLLQGNFGSIPLDYVLRQKLQSRNLNKYMVEQLPIIPPAAYTRMFGPKSAADIVREAVLELTYTAHDMAPFARDLGHVDGEGNVLSPFPWDEMRRLHLRAKLDALYFILYGVFDPADRERSRDDIRYIYSTFPIVERQELAAHDRYLSRDLCLAYVNVLDAGQPDAVVSV
ncbi:Eco57I restriction-modification methylase domain-containing protein [Sphingomonas sp.]|uniref:Eco57I restriction-modification methylase domain-containing protein n=1 Tax=Sphingomonas sp. TaxID=28214 RepID=UPI003BAC729B